MSGDGEPVVPEVRHQPHHIAGHGALARLRVVGRNRWKRRTVVSAQVRRRHEVVFGQSGRHRVPGRVSARMTVQQHDRRAGTAVPDPQRDVIHAHMLKVETVEHEPLPRARAINTASVSFRHLVLDELALAKLELAQNSVRTGNQQ
jgi:hypothetical protein